MLKVAIVCPGIGECQRGFERLFSGLFTTLRGHLDVVLFKGSGDCAGDECVPSFLRRNGTFNHLLPLHRLFGKTAYHTESLTYGLGLLPHLRRGAFDVVHTIDPPLAKVLWRLRPLSGGSYRLLHTIACYMPHEFYPGAEHIHHIGGPARDAAHAWGFAGDYLTLIPAGFRAADFQPGGDRAALRRTYGVPEDAFVVLSVAAVNRKQKRLDHLIEEVARLPQHAFLLVDGSTERGGDVDLTVIDLARERLGGRCLFTHVASDRVIDLYRLADVKTLASLDEAFGIALIEAGMAGLPVLAHDAAHFRWLLRNEECVVDMTRPGALAARLRQVMESPGTARPREIASRFDWDVLRDHYVDLYRRVAALPLATPRPRA
jgi:glycosyltransferase involved in cell wall biosynthesis